MHTMNRFTHLAICCTFFSLFGCSSKDSQATDTSAAGGGGESTDPAGLSAADVAGTWNVRAVPFSGDTTPTMSVLRATTNNSGWTLTFPNRPPIATRARFDGDSLMTESGPYESVRRKGVQVTTTGVYRLQGATIVGTSNARYATRGVDSVMRFRVTGTRAP